MKDELVTKVITAMMDVLNEAQMAEFRKALNISWQEYEITARS